MASCSVDVLRGFSPPLSEELIARAAAWTPDTPTVPARRAASVVLVRETRQLEAPRLETPQLETYLLHRHARMAFAASMVVFPGGGMDPADEADRDPWRACAVRETAEETGVALAAADLVPWAEWTTPVFEIRRYRTRFYVAALPPGQVAADVSGETDAAQWLAPARALSAASRGELAFMPPTRSILMELAGLGSIGAIRAVGADRVIIPVTPEAVRDASGWRFRYPVNR